jgi:hypothetical protein
MGLAAGGGPPDAQAVKRADELGSMRAAYWVAEWAGQQHDAGAAALASERAMRRATAADAVGSADAARLLGHMHMARGAVPEGVAAWTRAERSRDPAPFPMDLTGPTISEWRAKLDGLSTDSRVLAPELRERVDACVDWLDVAARSDRWAIIIPAAFSAMEALLVPEKAGLKAGVVTVRSVAVHVAVGERFFDPGNVMAGYQLRSDLVHGTPTSDVLEKEATEFAEFTRLWAFEVFRDYLKLAQAISAEGIAAIVRHLDSGPCEEVCSWLEEHGGSSIVAEYRDALRPRDERGQGWAEVCAACASERAPISRRRPAELLCPVAESHCRSPPPCR